MGAVQAGGEFVITHGDGAYVWDADGRRYVDATAGLWFTNVGHGRTEIAEAVARQIRRIAAYSTFGDYAVDTKIFFTSGGSDSVDTAVKLARRYWRENGRGSKTIVIGREKAYHGMHIAGTALAGIPGNHDGYGELMPDVRTIAWDTGKALLEAIEQLGADRIAAFFCEPVIGAGGIYPPPEGYLDEVRRICRENDILTTAKGLTSGYVPMGAVFVAPRVAEPFFDPSAGVWWRHGYTYGGHAAAAAAAMANLDIIEREDLLAASARLEKTLHDKFAHLAEHPKVAQVRSGTGAVAAVQLVDPAAALGLAKALRAQGVATRAVGAGGIQISPAFVITDDQVDELVAGFVAALD